MDKEKAKFILSAYQSGLPQTEGDEEMSAALEEAQQDRELGEWLREQTEFDERVSAAFREITVPQSLRRSILEGMELSSQRRPWWQRSKAPWTMWLGGALAAALVTLLLVLPGINPGSRENGGKTAGNDAARYEPWQQTALTKLSDGFQLEVDRGTEPGLSKGLIMGWLKGRGLPVPDSVMAKLDDNQLVGCFTVRNAPGDKSSTVCFNSKQGFVTHIVSAEVPPLPAAQMAEYGAPPGHPRMGTFGNLNTLSWREGGKAIMLVSNSPQEDLLSLVQ